MKVELKSPRQSETLDGGPDYEKLTDTELQLAVYLENKLLGKEKKSKEITRIEQIINFTDKEFLKEKYLQDRWMIEKGFYVKSWLSLEDHLKELDNEYRAKFGSKAGAAVKKKPKNRC